MHRRILGKLRIIGNSYWLFKGVWWCKIFTWASHVISLAQDWSSHMTSHDLVFVFDSGGSGGYLALSGVLAGVRNILKSGSGYRKHKSETSNFSSLNEPKRKWTTGSPHLSRFKISWQNKIFPWQFLLVFKSEKQGYFQLFIYFFFLDNPTIHLGYKIPRHQSNAQNVLTFYKIPWPVGNFIFPRCVATLKRWRATINLNVFHPHVHHPCRYLR